MHACMHACGVIHLVLLQAHDRAGRLQTPVTFSLAGSNGATSSPGAAAKDAATGADASQPTTNIQVRMSDGSKLKGTFNLSQTVGDIRK